jgi:hypothetical protein
MKDKHDKRTLDFVHSSRQEAHLAAQRLGAHPVYAAWENRLREQLISFVSVAFVASEWGVTARRVRVLLCAGRLAGRQLDNGYWEVSYPYTLTMGRRGPAMRKYGHRNPEQRAA